MLSKDSVKTRISPRLPSDMKFPPKRGDGRRMPTIRMFLLSQARGGVLLACSETLTE